MDIAILGAGQVARKLISHELQQGIAIVGIFDNDKKDGTNVHWGVSCRTSPSSR